jgi:hypothetical protein
MPMLRKIVLDDICIKSLLNTLIYLKNLKVMYICEDGFYDLCKKFENSWLSKKISHFSKGKMIHGFGRIMHLK